MTNNAKLIYTVGRQFQTRLGDAVMLPLAAFPTEEAAAKSITELNLQIHTAFGFNVASQDDQPLGPLGQVLLQLGIKGIGHVASGPLEMVEEGLIVQPSRIVIPRQG